MKQLIFLLVLIGQLSWVFAQEVTYSFRAGISIAHLDGPLETDANGMELEDFETNFGFHIGGGAKIKLGELYGVYAELLYSQKGGKYTYNGDSFKYLRGDQGTRILTTGNSEINLEINHSYIEIPVMAYGRFWDRIEVLGGAGFGFLVSATGVGRWQFDGQSLAGSSIELDQNLDYNYFKDEAAMSVNNEVTPISVNGFTVNVPNTLGAYYEFNELMEDDLYKRLDIFLTAGINVFINQGLYVGGKVQYGLLDVTKEELDYGRSSLENSEFVFRDDDDKTLNFQISLGFGF